MSRFFAAIPLSILALTFWLTCVSATVEDQLRDNYGDLVIQLSRMESKVTQLESLITALQKESLSNSRVKSLAEEQQIQRQQNNRESLRSGVSSESAVTQIDHSSATASEAVDRQTATKIPQSCQDLRCMGQNINGVYSVMGTKSVEMVFCDFSKTGSDPSFQQWIGFASVKKNPTYFYVQRRSYFYTVGVPIPYEISKLNIGGAMDLPSGKFTAPAKGTYFFSWTGMAAFQPSNTTKIGLGVRLYLNGNQDANRIGSSYVSDTNTGYQISPLTLQSTINLLPGDKVWLQIYTADTVMSLYDSSWYYTHFTGWLLDEDFSA